ncbi:hypothetical protein STEG23_029218 [Scotinomys teguina]
MPWNADIKDSDDESTDSSSSETESLIQELHKARIKDKPKAQDRQDPIWVPERLVRKARLPWTPENVEAIMPDAATSSAAGEDGTTVGDPVSIPEANADTA